MMISLGAIMIIPFVTHKTRNAYMCSINNLKAFSFNAAAAHHEPVPVQESDLMPMIKRRSGNYAPPLWNFDDIQSLNTEYSDETHLELASELKEKISNMMVIEVALRGTVVDQLEFIDDLQRLGVSYHFKDEIEKILACIYEQKYLKYDVVFKKDLYSEALAFRLMRQHGFKVSQDTFDHFKNEKGEFDSSFANDVKGLLQLYEASHLVTEGESTLALATEYTTILLQEKLGNFDNSVDETTTLLIRSALELPLHWRAERPNTRCFISAYERREDINHVVLDFAKLDFNILQSTYQEELKYVSRWWNRTRLAEKLPFARDRLVESYFWTVGFLFEPQYGDYRIMITKLINLIAIFDDIYDVYGTLEELQPFTNVIQSWDIKKMDQLPNYMQVFYSALMDFTNEVLYKVHKDQGLDITPYLRKTWTDYANVNLQEAKWYYKGYTPKFEEYINSAWISVSGPVVLTHAYFLLAKPIKEEVVRSLYKYHDIIRSSSMIFRLADDLGTSPVWRLVTLCCIYKSFLSKLASKITKLLPNSDLLTKFQNAHQPLKAGEEMKRGDVSKSIQCYMNETGVSEREARDYVSSLIRESWKKLNTKGDEGHQFPNSFITSAMALGRMSHHVYQHGDGYGAQNALIMDRILSLIFEPIL